MTTHFCIVWYYPSCYLQLHTALIRLESFQFIQINIITNTSILYKASQLYTKAILQPIPDYFISLQNTIKYIKIINNNFLFVKKILKHKIKHFMILTFLALIYHNQIPIPVQTFRYIIDNIYHLCLVIQYDYLFLLYYHFL